MTEQELSLESLRDEVRASREEFKELRDDIKELVTAWKTARGLVRFVKWLGGLAAALTAIWIFWRTIGKG